MPETVGLIDGLDGANLCGWAVSSSRRPALVVVRDDAGAVLARGPAAGERPDLASLGLCTTEVGFRFPVCAPGVRRPCTSSQTGSSWRARPSASGRE